VAGGEWPSDARAGKDREDDSGRETRGFRFAVPDPGGGEGFKVLGEKQTARHKDEHVDAG
jgi:hypothetical protein